MTKHIEYIINSKRKKVVCKQKRNQYFYTIPSCLTGLLGGYCKSQLKPYKSTKQKSCRSVRLVK